MNRFTLKARYVFPVSAPPIPDGAVTIENGRIISVGRASPGGEFRDLGNVAITPGFVNSHTHLDFSDLAAPIGQPGIAMTDWIRLVVAHRLQSNAADNAVSLGIKESLRFGVTTLGDIVQTGWKMDSSAPSPNVRAFRELIAPTASQVANALNRITDADNALSPHAPYSVHPKLLEGAISLAKTRNIPIAMHLAESSDEIELLHSGGGPLRKFLEEIGAWEPGVIRPNSRPLDYLRSLADAPQSLVVHGNYLDDEEIAFVGNNAARMTVVYCPRSSRWFGRNACPLEKLLAAGSAVALGTDGRGSSPDLSLLAEMRLAAQNHPTVPLNRILAMGTIVGARALGWSRQTGSIEPEKQADLAVVALPNRETADPLELLFNSSEPVVGCYCSGSPLALWERGRGWTAKNIVL